MQWQLVPQILFDSRTVRIQRKVNSSRRPTKRHRCLNTVRNWFCLRHRFFLVLQIDQSPWAAGLRSGLSCRGSERRRKDFHLSPWKMVQYWSWHIGSIVQCSRKNREKIAKIAKIRKFEFFTKNRQIEGISALLSPNVNKLSRIFCLLWFWISYKKTVKLKGM